MLMRYANNMPSSIIQTSYKDFGKFPKKTMIAKPDATKATKTKSNLMAALQKNMPESITITQEPSVLISKPPLLQQTNLARHEKMKELKNRINIKIDREKKKKEKTITLHKEHTNKLMLALGKKKGELLAANNKYMIDDSILIKKEDKKAKPLFPLQRGLTIRKDIINYKRQPLPKAIPTFNKSPLLTAV